MVAVPQLDAFSVFRELVSTQAVRRLGDVKFLGAIEQFSSKQKSAGSRLDHSIEVAHLAFLSTIGLDPREQETAIAAAILHDVGHGPLSHSTESFFKEVFGIDHRTEGLRTVHLDTEVVAALIRHGLDPDRVSNLAFGKNDDPLSFVFHKPINIDTIEGIRRSAIFFGIDNLPTIEETVTLLVTPDKIAERSGDQFWSLKNIVYNEYILAPWALSLDVICRLSLEEMMKTSGVSRSDFSLTDDGFLGKFGKSIATVFEKILHVAQNKPELISHLSKGRRHFAINSKIEIHSPEDLVLRYNSRK